MEEKNNEIKKDNEEAKKEKVDLKKEKNNKEKNEKSKDKKPKKEKKKDEIVEGKKKGKKRKKKKRNKVLSVIINLLEILIFIGLIIFIVYLVKSENGLEGKLHQKNASEKLDAAIKSYSDSSEEEKEDRELEYYLRQIDGLQKIKVDKEANTIELTIDGQSFFVVTGGNSMEQYDSGNGKIIDGIYVEEVESISDDAEIIGENEKKPEGLPDGEGSIDQEPSNNEGQDNNENDENNGDNNNNENNQ